MACGLCHVAGDKVPARPPSDWAPDFLLARERLKPDWLLEWIADAGKLMPKTKMPTYFPEDGFDDSGPDDILGGDETKQIRALRNFLLGFGAEKGKTANSKQTMVGEPVSRTFTASGD